MYLPWYIPKDFPNSSLSESDQEKLILMINHKQSTVDWSKCQMFWYILSRIVCPPISDSVHRSIRRRHFNLLQDEIYKTFNLEFWAMNGSQGKTLRVATSTNDYQLAYLDFIDFEKEKSDYIGPQLPLTLLLAGRGTFNSPYYLNFEHDALAKSVVFFH